MSNPTHFRIWPLVCLLLGACATMPGGDRATFDRPWGKEPQLEPPAERQARVGTPAAKAELDSRFALERSAVASRPPSSAELYRGSGSMIDLGPGLDSPPIAEGDITLNFQDIEIAEVVKIVLGEILRVNYVLDKNVSGSVSLQTSRPLQRDDLLPILETLLQLNGAVLVRSQGLYEVVPVEAAPAGAMVPRLSPQGQRGYQLLVVPLRYIAAAEMHKILEPLRPNKGLLQVDEARNLLLVAGNQQELNNIRDTVRVFDVDQLRGMSVGLFRLQEVDARVLLGELDAIFGDTASGPLAGVVRFLPIERLNALMVITPQAKYLEDARAWVQRLDRAENAQGASMFVYQVKNGKAPRLAEILNALLEGQKQSRPEDEGQALPVRRPAPVLEGETEGETPTALPETSLNVPGVEGSNLEVGAVSVIADEENNALLVLATPGDYDKLLRVIRKLDVLPLQVLVEATIVEVALEDELRYGLQWFFNSNLDGKSVRGTLGRFPLVTPTDLTPTGGLAVFDAAGARLLLDLLASDSKINVISSPTLMVQDNRTATIRVGDQVPVRTSETTNTSGVINQPGDPSALVTSTIQFRDTGVLLEVKPRINAGGMIALEITQEVNDVKATTTSGIDSPTITQRRINTSVSVLSGETLVLGGLIKENNGRVNEGLPYLRNIPVLGWAFGSQGKSLSRTELVVMITPSVVSTLDEARDVTQEYRSKLKDISLPQDARQNPPREL
ncbi:type II secretion system secretin GspD [Pseudomonas sp. XK-1]|uniref:type II secretion system secretin GspD n=1 Tax=Pseudomonas sp. XK-1 TaxID=3136019 RepID=UPI00311A5333